MLKVILRYDALCALSEVITKTIEMLRAELTDSESPDADCLLIAALEDFWREIERKKDRHKYKPQKEYKLNISPVHGFAIREAYAGFLSSTTYEGHIINPICDKINQAYA